MSQHQETRPRSVTGQLRKLPGGRLVFVGSDPEHPDNVYTAFRNVQGEDTYLVFSKEGASALRDLLNGERAGPDRPYPHILRWEMTIE